MKLKNWYIAKNMRVTSDEYRRGWDNTFGKKKIRPIKDEKK